MVENSRKMLNGKGLKPEALLFPYLDVTVLWYHNREMLLPKGNL
jgi:hypothetical protein